jgi:hypothetical protein
MLTTKREAGGPRHGTKPGAAKTGMPTYGQKPAAG